MSRVLVDSGIKWIGFLPNTWSITTVNKLFYRRKEVNDSKNPTILSLARDGVKIRDISTNEGQLAESYDNYHKVYKGDLLINPMDLISGANCSLSKVEGVISPAYINLAKKTNVYSKYYDYFFKYQYWIKAMFIHGKGVSFNNRWTINWETMASYKVPYPTYDEQKRIADYLDKKCSKINEIIKDNNKEIELLNEYKKSKINEVVSFGLKNGRKLEKSNNLFFPYIPQGWKFKKIKYIINSISKGSGITKDDIVEDGDIQCIRYGEIYTKYDNYFYHTVSKTNINKVSSPKYIKKGDIICTCTGELLEEIGKNVLYLGEEPCLAGGDIIVINHNQNAKYLNYLMNCLSSQAQKSMGKTKLKVVHISGSEIGNIRVPLPPIEEQNEIADFLDKLYIRVDKVIEYRKQVIEKLEEYKKSLIYECVTGKREV